MERFKFSFLTTMTAMFFGAMFILECGPAYSQDSLIWVRTGGPPGGLGYDIRYNFADPNTWYVTDNYAGIHISTDNGQTWQSSNTGIPPQAGPTGDAIPIFCLTVDPLNPQIVWAGTDATGHIYKSTDAGRTWVEKNEGVVIEYDALTFRGFTIDPGSSDIVYATGETTRFAEGDPIWIPKGGVVYKTTDGGESWEMIWDGVIPSSLARYLWVDPRDTDVLYVSTGIFDRGAAGQGELETDPYPFGGLGILKSSDGGQNWRELNESNGLGMLYIGSLYMHPENPDILLAAAGHSVSELAVQYFRELGGSTGGIYRTTNGGENWTQALAPPLERVHEVFTSVEFCTSDPNIAYAGSELAVYRSEDAGETLELVSGGAVPWGPPGVRAGWPIDMQCDPRPPYRIFANNYNGGNFLSEDGGHSWQNASQGYTGAQTQRVAVDPFETNRVYATVRGGAWHSDDGGATWNGLHNPQDDHPVAAGEFAGVAFDPSRPNHVLLGGEEIVELSEQSNEWQSRGLPAPFAPLVSVIVFAPSDPTIVYAGRAEHNCLLHHAACGPIGGVVVSHDGGTSWQGAMGAQLGKVPVFDQAVDPTDAEIVYAASQVGLYKTIDGGRAWARIYDDNVRTVAVNPTDPQNVLAGVHEKGLFMSRDGGEDWRMVGAGLEPNGSHHDIVFDPSNSLNVYVSDLLSGVYRSLDGGETWMKINNGLRTRAATGLAVSSDGLRIYAATNGEGVFRLDLKPLDQEFFDDYNSVVFRDLAVLADKWIEDPVRLPQ